MDRLIGWEYYLFSFIRPEDQESKKGKKALAFPFFLYPVITLPAFCNYYGQTLLVKDLIEVGDVFRFDLCQRPQLLIDPT